MIDRSLIETIVMEVIRALENDKGAEPAPVKPRLLIIGDASWIFENTLDKLKRKWNLSYSREPGLEECESVDHIVFFQASQDLIVKGALGIADTPETILLSHCLLAGKEVTISPETNIAKCLQQSSGQANGYVQMLLKYKEQLSGFGAIVEAIEDFAEKAEGSQKAAKPAATATAAGGKKKLLTQRDVQDSKSAEIIVCKSTIITPSARDAAKELNKSIIVAE